jgi:transposase InsO family protein
MFLTIKTHQKKELFSMTSITSMARFRQRVVKYAEKHGVTKASIRHRVSRNAIYEWKKKYDGNWKSLRDKSHRPHFHPNQHTEQELEMIKRHFHYHKDDLIVLWDTIRKKGYTRHYNSMLRVIRKMGLHKPKQPKGYTPKPYKRADYPGQKLQLDVKFVPNCCVSNGQKYYQYTVIDECSRVVFREMYDEHSTYSSKDFLMKLVEQFPFPIREIQTDNGTEFTSALLVKDPKTKSLFEKGLEEMDILYHRIRIATPRHNGKVERQHRIDGQRFYKKMKLYNLEDGRKQLAKYNKRSGNIPKICLNFLTPNEVLEKYLGVM